VGEDNLANFIHLFELIILFECWLDHDCFTWKELKTATRFLPVLIETFVKNVKHDNGKGTNLPKIHQLRHFIPQIYEFGSASNITG